jgi:hypothetical protein
MEPHTNRFECIEANVLIRYLEALCSNSNTWTLMPKASSRFKISSPSYHHNQQV